MVSCVQWQAHCHVTQETKQMKSKQTARLPKEVKFRAGCAFSIRWFATEEDANIIGAAVRASGATYNGGYYHGRPCGRDKGFDYIDPVLGQIYAVTD